MKQQKNESGIIGLAILGAITLVLVGIVVVHVYQARSSSTAKQEVSK